MTDVKIKRPKTAWLHFCDCKRSEVKADFPELSPKEVLTKLGELWQECKTAKGEADYIKMAEDGKTEYNEKYGHLPKDTSAKKATKKKDKDGSVKSEDASQSTETEKKEPKKLNGYMKYLGAHREELKADGKKPKEITKELAARWMELSDEEKQKWKDM